MPVTTPFEFDDEWASATDWARMYRGLNIQVMPAHNPSDGGQWKRPIMDWLEFRDTLIPDALFARLYDPDRGEQRLRKNMGMITGAASGGLFMLDLDVKPGSVAQTWFAGLLAVHNNDADLDTPTQRTGGGGLQVLLRAPIGWAPPTFKTPIGIDVRGQGGFAMLPPSRHASGKVYEWLAGREPWACDPILAPEWLIAAIEEVREAHGGGPPGAQERTPSEAPKNAFGLDVDDREHKLQAMVWGAVVDLYREAPIPPTEEVQQAERKRLFVQYEQTTKSRLTGPQYDGLDNAQRLEREGRGYSELLRKWQYAMGRWDTKVREAAALPKPGPGPSRRDETPNTWGDRLNEALAPDADPEPDSDLFEVLSMADLAAAPDVEWLIKKHSLPRAGLGLLFGAPGSFKTFVALDMALALAYGLNTWLDREASAGSVLYIAAEGSTGLYKRIVAWRRKHGHDTDSDRFHLIRQSMSFLRAADVERLARTVSAHVATHGPLALIVVDTVSRVLPGADENLQKDMTLFIAACDRLRTLFGAAVLGLHHTNKAGDMRGSSVLSGAADSIFRVERSEDEPRGALICEKQKDAEDGWRRPFAANAQSWTPDGHIEISTSLVIDWTAREADDGLSSWPPRAILRAMQWAIHAAFEKGEPLSMEPRSKTSGRYAAGRLAHQFELRSKVVFDVLQVWLDQGVIEVAMTNSHTKLRGLEVVKWLD